MVCACLAPINPYLVCNGLYHTHPKTHCSRMYVRVLRYGNMVVNLRKFWNATEAFWSVPANVAKVVEIEHAGDTFESSVGHIDIMGTFEYGERSGLHVHLVLTLHHCTSLRIDRSALKTNMDQIYKEITRGTYNHIQYIRNPLANTKSYITKHVHNRNLRMFKDFAYCENPDVNLKLHIAANIATVFPRVVPAH